jgi:multiple antibiotic resistance protein
VNYTSIDFQLVVDIFLLLLIGVGPKIALVPFLDLTRTMDDATKARVIGKMLTTAAVVAVVLMGLGELLSRLLHFSTGSLSIAGGIVLLIIAVNMVLGSGSQEASSPDGDPMQLAVFPLAVADSVAVFAVVLGVLAVVLALDVVVFRWANRVSGHLDVSRMLVVEKVFGVLLSALAVQLALNGLDSVGVIELGSH